MGDSVGASEDRLATIKILCLICSLHREGLSDISLHSPSVCSQAEGNSAFGYIHGMEVANM